MKGLAGLLLAGCLAASLGWAGTEPPGRYLFKTYGAEQGFNEPGLTTLAQDSDGFIWVGGDTGLVRYDGVSFRKWTARDGLASTAVSRILPRRGGGIWVMSEGGLVRFVKGQFTPILHNGHPFQPSRGSAMDTDGDGVLWALGRDGLYRQSGDLMERVLPFAQGQGRALACRAASGSVFAVVGEQVWEKRLDGSVGRFTAEDGLPADGIETMAVDGEGRLWVVGTRLLRYQDPGDPSFRDASSWLPAPPFPSCTINRQADGSICIPTNSGLLRLKGDDHESIDEGAGLPCKWTVSSLKDRENNLWVLGPTLYRQLGRGFTRAFTSRDGLPSDLVWQVFRDRSGRLFAGTSEGLALLGRSGWTRVPGTDALNVTSLSQDGAGRLFIGSSNGVLRTLEPGASAATDSFFKRCHWAGSGNAPMPMSVLASRDGTLWLSDTGRGVFQLDPAHWSLSLAFGPVQAGVPDCSVFQMKEDREGRLWAASSRGLVLHDGAGWHRFGCAQGLKAEALNGLALCRDGSAWLLYREPMGITRVAFQGGTLRILEHQDVTTRLSSNVTYAAAEDAQGALWLGSDRGVEVLHGTSAAHFSHGGGLVGNDCSQGAIFVDVNQDVWVGTSTGLARLVAGRRPKALEPLEVQISQVTRGLTVNWPPYSKPEPVRHRDATLEFRFASQTYISEQAVQYQVRLRGLEDDWRRTDVPQARYAALPGGSYRFEARAAYPGMPFGPVASYPFEVLAPWWRTWWFLGLEVLAGLAGLSMIMNWRFRALAHQKERLAGLVDKATGDLLKANQALEKANLALKAQSLSDPLTGLHNRRFLSMIVDDDVAKVQRSYRDWRPGQPLPNNDLVFFMVDLDHFKVVNDKHGHAVGDRVLERVALALRKAARDTDGVIRWGGEEFLVLARNSTRTEAFLMAERIRAVMSEQELVLESGEVLRWTCSVGYAPYPFSLEDVTWMGWERVVEIADACLYLAKKAGRDGWAGTEALPGLDRALHGPRLPWEVLALVGEGVLELRSSKRENLRKARAGTGKGGAKKAAPDPGSRVP